MLCRSVQICNQKGLHARAAAKFVRCAMTFESEILVKRLIEPVQGELMSGDEAMVSARSILGLMMLGAHKGITLEVMAEGADAPEALDAIEALICNRFDEEE